ncbi:MAG: helix-turn-helix domain-containing protein [Planctomycetota bacterium]
MLERGEERVVFGQGGGGEAWPVVVGERFRAVPRSACVRVPSYFLLHYVSDGTGRVAFDGGAAEAVAAGGWFLCRPGRQVAYTQDADRLWRYRWVGFEGAGSERLLARAGLGGERCILQGEPMPAIPAAFDALMEALDDAAPGGDLRAEGALLALFGQLRAAAAGVAGGDAAEEPAGFDDVEAARRFVLQHYAEGINAQDVAAHVGYDRAHFSRKFRARSGMTLRSFLAAVRQEKAAELLRAGRLSVDAIARAVGYGDGRALARFFRRRSGASPAAYRARHAGRG